MIKSDTVYTDLLIERDASGVYDLVIDTETGDLALIDGLESAFMISVFSDRRASEDEVTDPLKRRGWIGDLVSDVPDDTHGSGLWLYDQKKLTSETAIGLKNEAERALRWMKEDGLVTAVEATVKARPADRAVDLVIKVGSPGGGQSIHTYTLADNTRRRAITNQS